MASPDKLEGYSMKLLEFTKAIESVEEEIETVIQHLQSIEGELQQEDQNLKGFIRDELQPMIKGGNYSKQELAELINDEDAVERSIEKVNGDLENEISELKGFMSDIRKLEKEARKAEQSLEKIESIEKSLR